MIPRGRLASYPCCGIDGWEVDGEADEAVGGSAVDKGSSVVLITSAAAT
jgi:hypothetical protein